MENNCWFQCINEDCGATYSVFDSVYQCRDCGELLEVIHDIDALRGRSASEWRHLFDDRYKRNAWPYGSGVWGKKEWVMPLVEDDNIISFYEGGTNLFWANRLSRELGLSELWIKQCGNSHTGSFKDLGMTVLVSVARQMIADGRKIRALACASTGDTSAALAAYCAAADIPAIVFLPRDKVSTAQLIQPIANGATVMALDTDFDGCMKLVQELCREEDIYLANSMNSLRIEGQKTVGIEMVQQFDWHVPDWIVIPGGNLGNVSALGKGFLEMQAMGIIDRLPGIVVAQAQRANPLYRSFQNEFETFEPMLAGDTLASAIRIGDPVSYERAVRVIKRFDGVVEQASEHELADACARADRTGLFSCPHTGVALAALLKLIDRGTITSAQKVVVISTAHGLKFPEFKVRYHEDQLRESHEVNPMHSNQPVEVDPDYDQVRSAIFRNLEAVQA